MACSNHELFVPRECSAGAPPPIAVAAGSRMFEFYDAAAPHNSIIVGANDPDAGLGDFLAGGNQSPISGQYGIGADNVLELKVVTPAGDTETENQCSAPDLFFAFRGVGILSFLLTIFHITSLCR